MLLAGFVETLVAWEESKASFVSRAYQIYLLQLFEGVGGNWELCHASTAKCAKKIIRQA